MRKQQIAIVAFAFWLILVSVFMIFIQQVDLEIFFVSALIGVLIIMQLMEQHYVQPNYLRYIRYLMAVGIMIFGAIIIHKIMDILAP